MGNSSHNLYCSALTLQLLCLFTGLSATSISTPLQPPALSLIPLIPPTPSSCVKWLFNLSDRDPCHESEEQDHPLKAALFTPLSLSLSLSLNHSLSHSTLTRLTLHPSPNLPWTAEQHISFKQCSHGFVSTLIILTLSPSPKHAEVCTTSSVRKITRKKFGGRTAFSSWKYHTDNPGESAS